LASGSGDGSIKLWDITSGACQRTLNNADRNRNLNYYAHSHHNADRNRILVLSFSPDSRCLASSSHDGTIKLWDIKTGSCQRTLEGHSSGVKALSFSSDGSSLASGSNDSTIKLWDFKTGNCQRTMEGHLSSIISLSFSA
jgi:WD40 repeat protein